MSRETIRLILGPMRLPFLVLPPACVMLGAATAYWTGSRLDLLILALAFVGALAAHVSVNALNEWHDYHSGLDDRTERTPFSGGSGTLQAHRGKAHVALITGVASAALTAAIGLYFTWLRGWMIVPLGLFGLLIIVLYTRWITRSPLICLAAPGLGFGLLMVMGTDFVLSGSYSWASFVASLTPTFLVSDLLLINQLPDIEADRSAGRRHLPIVIGARASAVVYAAFLAATYLSIAAGVLLRILPAWSLLGLATIVFAVPTARGAIRHAESIPDLVPHLGRNVLVVILTPVLLAIGIFLGR